MQCPQCAAVVTDPSGRCQACGHVPSLTDGPGQPPRIEPEFRDAPSAGAPSPVVQELYQAALGAKGQHYYLRQFARFDQAGKTRATWHWPAFFSTLNWLAWRGMWSAALVFAAVCLGLGLLVFGIGRLVFDFSTPTELALAAVCLALVFVLPGLFGNAVYYRFTKKRIETALAAAATVDEACQALAFQAGSNRRWYGLAATNASLLVVVGLFAWLASSSTRFEPASATAPAPQLLGSSVTLAAPSVLSVVDTANNAPAPHATPAPEILRVSQSMAPGSAPVPPVQTAPARAQQSGPIGNEPAGLQGKAPPQRQLTQAAPAASAPSAPSSAPHRRNFDLPCKSGRLPRRTTHAKRRRSSRRPASKPIRKCWRPARANAFVSGSAPSPPKPKPNRRRPGSSNWNCRLCW